MQLKRRSTRPLFSRVFSLGDLFRNKASADDLFTPLPDALAELKRRAQDASMRAKVEEYLGNNLPSYFSKEPIAYMARHVATPNFETLRFLHLTEDIELERVIGQDSRDLFTSQNPLKYALGRMPICMRISQKEGKYNEQYEKLRVIDFNTMNGKRLEDVTTLWGEPLISFHNELLRKLSPQSLHIEDDAAWIDATDRGDLRKHYKKFLALFVLHGVMFEDYLTEDKHEGRFVTEVLRPAFEFIEKKFGCKPLITRLTPTSIESIEYWMSYPTKVRSIVQEKLTP